MNQQNQMIDFVDSYENRYSIKHHMFTNIKYKNIILHW
jgi:hypothetical protein